MITNIKITSNILNFIDDNNEVKFSIPMDSITDEIVVNENTYSAWINILNQTSNFNKDILYKLAKIIKEKRKSFPFDFNEQFFDIEICEYLNQKFYLKHIANSGTGVGLENHYNFIRFQFEREENNEPLQNLINEVVNANLIKYKIN